VAGRYTRVITCAPDAAVQARRFVRNRLAALTRRGDRQAVETAELLTSELIGNAVKACREVIRLTVSIGRHHVEIQVYDDGPGRPHLKRAGPTDLGGRGLRIVAALATAWGVRPISGNPLAGKTVWFRLRVPAALALF
jgi:anti-sigma regulatory factor (Ser/Thr protein kinase)